MVYDDIYATLGEYLGVSAEAALAFILIISVWTLVWKGFALWKASKKNSIPWFVILLVVNTLGILEILYLFLFSKLSFKNKKLKFNKKK